MAKPSFTIFVGVSVEGLPDEDLAKLPQNIRHAYGLLPEYDPGEEVVVDGLEFESFDFGRDDSADPGGFAGFGVSVFGEWYDAGTNECDISEIAAAEAMRQKVQTLFRQWGLSAKVRILCFAGYDS